MLLGHAARVRQSEQVALGPAVAAAVLDRLVGQAIGRLGVSGGHGALEAAPPAPEALGELGEVEQVGAGPADARQRLEGCPPRGLVARLAASASTKMAGSFLGTCPVSEISTTRRTTAGPSASIARSTASEFSSVSGRSAL